ncbi:MAG: N-acetylmuramoyl-L-alanine amidase family protein, partial [Bacteroidia bacterium]
MRLASYVESESKLKSRGVKQAGFLVLWKTSMPAILVETGFITNQEDRNYLASERGQDTIAQGILKAVKNYKSLIEKT